MWCGLSEERREERGQERRRSEQTSKGGAPHRNDHGGFQDPSVARLEAAGTITTPCHVLMFSFLLPDGAIVSYAVQH